MRKKLKSERFQIVLFLIIILAIVLRINCMDLNRSFSSPDEPVYHYAAENLLKYSTFTMDREGAMFRGEREVIPADNLQVGYPLFVTLIYLLFGAVPKNVYIAQFILSILNLFLIYLIMKSLNIRNKSILVAMLIAAIYPGFIYNIDRMLTEHLVMTLLLSYVYFFIKGLHTNKIYFFVLSALCGGYATLVRGPALIMYLLGLIVLLVYGKPSQKIIQLFSYVGSFLVTQVWFWIRNYLTFKKIMLLPTTGSIAKKYGMMPYYMDMTSSYGKTLEELTNWALSIDIFSFFEWRIFGMFHYMWGDVWDENLVHPGELYYFIGVQLIIIACIILIPKLIKKAKGEELLIISFPIMFTIMYLPYHGLPRYVYPSVPFVIIILAMLLDSNILSKRELLYDANWKNSFDNIIKKAALLVTSCFSIILLFSILFFSWNINKEMSDWRLNRQYGISSSEINTDTIMSQKEYKLDDVSIQNCISLGNGDFKVDTKAPPIIIVTSDKTDLDTVVTKVRINTHGGYLFDKMTVYWKSPTITANYDEDYVYSFPINCLEDEHIIYIDDDVTELRIVPIVYRNGSFHYESILIEKYLLNFNEAIK